MEVSLVLGQRHPQIESVLILRPSLQLASLDRLLGSRLANEYISLQEQDILPRSNHVPNVGVRVALEQARSRRISISPILLEN